MFGGLDRRRLFHLAFERRFRTQTLDALAVYTRRPAERVQSPRFQAVFCIDTREESFRRHLEELIPEAETFSTAGFFGVAIYYRGVADAHFAALCPIVIKPKHWVTEEVVYPLEESHRRGPRRAVRLERPRTSSTFGSRAIAAGAVLSAGLGVLASVPLVVRVMFPRADRAHPADRRPVCSAAADHPAAVGARPRRPPEWKKTRSGFRWKRCAISANGCCATSA